MRLVFITAPVDAAASIVETLVEERLVACGNILADARSFYRWDGELQDDREAVVLMETGTDRIDALMARLDELHPYDVPKIVVLSPDAVNDAYLQWVRAETRRS